MVQSSNATVTAGVQTDVHLGSTPSIVQNRGLTHDFGAAGFPCGRVGIYTDSTLVKFNQIDVWPHDEPSDLAGRWDRYSSTGSSPWGIRLINTDTRRHYPTMLRGVRLPDSKPWRVTFRFRRSTAARNRDSVRFLFDATGPHTYHSLAVHHGSSAVAAGWGAHFDRGSESWVAADSTTPANVPAAANAADWMWVRVESNGTKVTVKQILDNTGAPSETGWSARGTAYESSHFSLVGGQAGFRGVYGSAYVSHVTVQTDADNNGTYTTEYVDEPSAWSEYETVTHAHDAAGNLTYDGTYAYTYDAWNRLVEVAVAYRGSGGTLVEGSVVNEIEYDGTGRRIVKAVKNSAGLDCTYHYYYDGQSIIEARDGSDNVLRQNVWGLQYIDELVQTSLNADPDDANEDDVETDYFALHNASYNVVALVDSSGGLVERYEYTPYGQRQVYLSAGANDPLALSPTSISQRFEVSSVAQPYGLNPFGHQGLYHDEELGNDAIHNRARYLKGGRYLQRDPTGYPDGMNGYAYYAGMLGLIDPYGLEGWWITRAVKWYWKRAVTWNLGGGGFNKPQKARLTILIEIDKDATGGASLEDLFDAQNDIHDVGDTAAIIQAGGEAAIIAAGEEALYSALGGRAGGHVVRLGGRLFKIARSSSKSGRVVLELVDEGGKHADDLSPKQVEKILDEIRGAIKKWPENAIAKPIPAAFIPKEGCDEFAEFVLKARGQGKIHKIQAGSQFPRPIPGMDLHIGPVRDLNGDLIEHRWYNHYVVIDGDMVYDKITGSVGLHIDEYKKLFEWSEDLDFVPIDP